jgi:hypothetical protein
MYTGSSEKKLVNTLPTTPIIRDIIAKVLLSVNIPDIDVIENTPSKASPIFLIFLGVGFQ